MGLNKSNDINLDNIDKINNYGFDEDVFTVDIYDDNLMNELNEVFIVNDIEDKFTCAVKALHKYELKEHINSREKLVIKLFTEQQRLNLFEFFRIKDDSSGKEDNADGEDSKSKEDNNNNKDKWLYDDSKLFEKLGMFAVQMNEYSAEELQDELWELVKVNLEDFSKLDSNMLNKLSRETSKISTKLAKSNNEVNMINILGRFQKYLIFLKVELANDILEEYFIYKGWKMIAILRQQESFKSRRALEDRRVNLTTEYKTSRYYYSDEKTESASFYDSLIEDLMKYERYVLSCYVNQSPKFYKELISDYYEVVLTALTLRDKNAIAKYKSMVSHGYYNNKTNEKYLRRAINKVYKANLNGNLKQDKLKDVCTKLHITTNQAEKYDLKFLYLHTGLSQWMKAEFKSDNRPVKRKDLEDKWYEDRVNNGKKIWMLHVKDKKSFKQISDEKLIDIDRELISEKFYSYVRHQFNILELNGHKEKYADFKNSMGLTDKQFEKNIPHD